MKTLIILIILLLSPVTAFSEESVYIEGQDIFNNTVSEMTAGNFSFDIENFFQSLSDMFTSQIRANTHYLIMFFIIGVISSVISLTDFNNKSSNEAAFFACYTLCAGIALKILGNILEYAVSVVDSMADFITKLSPILTTLLLTSGKAASAGAFHPILSAAVFVVTLIVKKCIIPLSVYGSVLSVVSNLNDHMQISGFCKLISSVSKWILTGAFTIFAGICGIYGFAAPAIDALSAKTARFAVGTLVPVVGRFLSDSLETVVSGSQLIKNTAGSAGIFVLFSICSVPIVKISVMLLFVRFSSALIEPLADKKIAGLLSDIADVSTVIFGMVLTVTILFIICISIIIGATN